MYTHKPQNLVACICEGNAEIEIIEHLLNKELLQFSKSDLLDNRLFTKLMRSPKNLETRYLSQNFESNQKVEVIRIVDSRTERFKIRQEFKLKIEGDITNCFPRPEIEILIIINEGKYDHFKRSRKKPSQFCIDELGITRKIKSKGFYCEYFKRYSDLIAVLEEYHRRRPDKDEDTIFSLLK